MLTQTRAETPNPTTGQRVDGWRNIHGPSEDDLVRVAPTAGLSTEKDDTSLCAYVEWGDPDELFNYMHEKSRDDGESGLVTLDQFNLDTEDHEMVNALYDNVLANPLFDVSMENGTLTVRISEHGNDTKSERAEHLEHILQDLLATTEEAEGAEETIENRAESRNSVSDGTKKTLNSLLLVATASVALLSTTGLDKHFNDRNNAETLPAAQIVAPLTGHVEVEPISPPIHSEGAWGMATKPNIESAAQEEGQDTDLESLTSAELAHHILEHHNITIDRNSPDDRVYKSIAYLAEHGSTFLYDVDQIGEQEIPIEGRLLEALLDVADRLPVHITSLSTSREHSPNSRHYMKESGAVDIRVDENASEIMQFLNENSETYGIHELIGPDTAHTLKNGEPHTYDKDTIKAHGDHIHFSVFSDKEVDIRESGDQESSNAAEANQEESISLTDNQALDTWLSSIEAGGEVAHWLPLMEQVANDSSLSDNQKLLIPILVNQESAGNRYAHNEASGAKGLGQIMPFISKILINERGFSQDTDLSNPKDNLEMMAYLMKEMDGEITRTFERSPVDTGGISDETTLVRIAALAAFYNGGGKAKDQVIDSWIKLTDEHKADYLEHLPTVFILDKNDKTTGRVNVENTNYLKYAVQTFAEIQQTTNAQ